MAKDLVLLTGATGFIGFRILRYAIEQNYHVRCAVRSSSKADSIRDNAALKATPNYSPDAVSYVVIPDFAAPGAFDAACKDIKYIIHVAAPLPFDVPEGTDYEAVFVQPAIQFSIGMFESAAKAKTVERIVITSSMIALIPIEAMFTSNTNEIYSAENRLPRPKPPHAGPLQAYLVSKIAALEAAESWVKQRGEEINFDVIHLHPTFVLGRDELATTAKQLLSSTNEKVLGQVLGIKDPAWPARPVAVASLDDTAMVHVRALEKEKVKGNQSFIISYPSDVGDEWDDINKIVKKEFPEAVKSGLLPNSGSMATVVAKLDTKKTEEVFGFKHKSFEELVVEVVGQYLELVEKEKKK